MMSWKSPDGREAPLGRREAPSNILERQYDWRQQKAKIDELLIYHTKIQVDGFEALDIHFVHQKSDVDNAIPLLFCYGWHGSFLEIVKILPLLTKAGKREIDDPASHVVTPSIPNYGFSEGIKKKGFVFYT